jgi:homoserine dehydrogenase
MRKVNIAVVGCGVVGSSLISQLDVKHQRIIDEFGIDIRVPKILVRNKDSKREAPVTSMLYSKDENDGNFTDVLTTDVEEIVHGEDIDLVVEVAGGIDDAHKIISAALSNSKSVVTANKALLALKGNELYSLAEKNGVDLLFEAAVGGGVPIIRPIRESLAVEHINSVRGILNGTTNFMLTQMTRDGMSYDEALSQAQALGYAEADPTADVEGHDAAAKIAIISLLATGANALAQDVQCVGISNISTDDIATAKKMGYVIKLIALVEERDENSVFLRVEPTFVPVDHPFSTVHDGFNAVFVEGEKLGEAMFYGRGAGGDPTASAVLGDTIDAAINISHERKGAVVGFAFDKKIADPREWESKFYVSAEVTDEHGVLVQIAEVLAKHKVSVEVINQDGHGETARLLFITHETADGNIKDAVGDLATLACVQEVTAVYPIMG